MGEPLLRKLYQDGVRDLIVRPASGGDYVPATKALRVRLPDGRQAGAIAQTDINGPVLSMLITQDGKGLVWCETAGQSVNTRTPELVRSRPQAVEEVPLTGGLFVLMLANTSTELWITGDGFESEKKLSVTLSTSFDFRKIGMAGNVDGQWMVVLSDNNLNTEESITIQVFMGDSTGQTSSQTLSLGTTILAEIGVMGYGDFQVYTYDAGFTTDTVKLYSATPSNITEVATSTAAYFNGFFFFSPNADLVTTFFVGDSYNLNSAVWDYNYGYFLQFGGTDRVCLTPSTRVDLLNAPPVQHQDSNVKGGFLYNVDNVFSPNSINLTTGDIAMRKYALNISTNPATATLQETLALSIPVPSAPVSPGARIIKYYPPD